MSMASVVAATLALSLHAATLTPANPDAYCDPDSSICAVEVTKDGRPADRERKFQPVKDGQRGEARSASIAPCRYVLYDPQPPKSDSIWGGRTTGAIYSYVCNASQ